MFNSKGTRGVPRAALWFFAATLLMLTAPAAHAQTNGPLGLSNIIQSVSVVNGQLVATTTTGQQLPITTTASRASGIRRDCGILNLALGPINLNLLGLQVDTSPICLKVTAQRGGGLLGDLLCSVANLLNRRITLAQILGGLSQTQLTQLLNGIRDLLNGALNTLNQAAVQTVTPAQQPGGCPVLNLVLGPLDLTLLGLNVHLDNCTNGPITVTATAIPGGGLLGDLLCGLLGGIPTGTTLQGLIAQVLQAILNALPTV